MRFTTTFIACAALLFGAQSLQAETIAPEGKSDRVEWQVRSSWQLEAEPLDVVHSLDNKLVFILTNDQKVLVIDNRGQLQGRIPVGENVTAIDIAPQGEALYLIDRGAKTFTAVNLNYVVDIDTAGSPVRGNPDAPVTIALFTDFE
jgi:DNA-binding beta-propeller fold protein YncE